MLSAAHNRAVTLRLLDRSAEALEVIEDAIRRGLQAPQSRLLRVDLIADTGKLEDAVDGYRSIVVANPAELEAHELLARLLPQIGQGDRASGLTKTRCAGSRASNFIVRRCRRHGILKQAAALERWAGDALRKFGEAQDVRLMLGMATASRATPRRRCRSSSR